MTYEEICRICELTGLSVNTVKSYLDGKTTFRSTRKAIEQAIEALKIRISDAR